MKYCELIASLTRLDPEPYNQYNVKYIGNCTVSRPAGIDIVRDAIGKLVTIHSENQWVEGVALISATTVCIKRIGALITFSFYSKLRHRQIYCRGHRRQMAKLRVWGYDI